MNCPTFDTHMRPMCARWPGTHTPDYTRRMWERYQLWDEPHRTEWARIVADYVADKSDRPRPTVAEIVKLVDASVRHVPEDARRAAMLRKRHPTSKLLTGIAADIEAKQETR